MSNSIKLKLYRIFTAKMAWILIGLIGTFSFVKIAITHMEASAKGVNLDIESFDIKAIFSMLTEGTLFVYCFTIVFTLLIGEFSFSGFNKNRIGYVQDWFADLISDVIGGIVFYVIYILVQMIGTYAGVLVFYPKSKLVVGNIKYVVELFFTNSMLYVELILLIIVIVRIFKTTSKVIIVDILYLLFFPMITMLAQIGINKLFDINNEAISKYEILYSLSRLNEAKDIWSDFGITCIVASVMCVIFSGIIYVLRKKDYI